MSKLSELRGDVFEAALAFDADRVVANRDALFAAIAVLRVPKFYLEPDPQPPLVAVLYFDGRGIEGRRWCFAETLADAADMILALNDKLGTGWRPAR
jgi:hypothetical protein